MRLTIGIAFALVLVGVAFWGLENTFIGSHFSAPSKTLQSPEKETPPDDTPSVEQPADAAKPAEQAAAAPATESDSRPIGTPTKDGSQLARVSHTRSYVADIADPERDPALKADLERLNANPQELIEQQEAALQKLRGLIEASRPQHVTTEQ